mmetsp:Transcript_858/g.2430  ORF Transcript_858/g.2430 Transcript_858/m.2430 type:complete len:228 (+) Transcript_858:154-837(+)
MRRSRMPSTDRLVARMGAVHTEDASKVHERGGGLHIPEASELVEQVGHPSGRSGSRACEGLHWSQGGLFGNSQCRPGERVKLVAAVRAEAVLTLCLGTAVGAEARDRAGRRHLLHSRRDHVQLLLHGACIGERARRCRHVRELLDAVLLGVQGGLLREGHAGAGGRLLGDLPVEGLGGLRGLAHEPLLGQDVVVAAVVVRKLEERVPDGDAAEVREKRRQSGHSCCR